MRFEMSQEQLDKILDASKPVPMIMLQCGTPSSPQDNANSAWEALGEEMGFDSKTVRPIEGQPNTVFEANAFETDFVPLKNDPIGWSENLRIRRWVEQALIAKGAIFKGGGVCAEHSSIDVNIDGDLYNIRITPR